MLHSRSHTPLLLLQLRTQNTIKMESESTAASPHSSTDAVSAKMQEGFRNVLIQGGVGLLMGGMAGIVLSRGGPSSARKVLAGFGGGIGAGSAWTKCSISIDELLSASSSS